MSFFGFGKKPDDAGSSKALFERYSVDTSKKFGEGGYGATYAATDKRTGERLAVKIIDTKRMKLEAIQRECTILEALKHTNIISVKGHGLGLDKHAHLYFIFMELAGGGELFDQVIDRGVNAMTEDVARQFFCQMLEGVAHCHLGGIAHRDLKLENVLLNETGVVKIIDFGLSHVYPKRQADGNVDRSKALRDVCGSKSYAAPEVLGAQGYDGYAADMWSLGVCLFAMLSGFFPLDEASHNDWRYPKLVQAQRTGRSSTAIVYSWYKRSTKHLSPAVIHLLDGLLTINPDKRLTMAQVREHPWTVNKLDEKGSYADVTDGDDPLYRGFGGMMEMGDEADMAIDDDDAPVYRSLAGMGDEDASPAAPPPLPGLCRQRARSQLHTPLSGMAALDALIVDPVV